MPLVVALAVRKLGLSSAEAITISHAWFPSGASSTSYPAPRSNIDRVVRMLR
jgi:hypothetical protein